MTYYANPRCDLPAPWKPKRAIFYRQGLKIYGQIPYILQRRLQAKFYSNNAPAFGGRIIAPTWEHNYTVVPYHRKSGTPHSQTAIEALLSWLYEDAGFQWAVAEDYDREICDWNVNQYPSQTWVPTTEKTQMEFTRLLTSGGENVSGPEA